MSDPTPSRDELAADVNEFVVELLDGYEPRVPTHSKVINDPIWGTQRFLPHEIALMDSPVVQRLRWLHQTGLSFFAFPSTHHSRFEHSLGALSVGTRLIEALAERHADRIDLDPMAGMLANVRAACLLHDCGHGFASHASEELYRWLPSMVSARQGDPTFANASPSEVLAGCVVESPRFREFLGEINVACGTSLDASYLSRLITGSLSGDDAFIGEILKGPFDVDRIDYIVRDGFYSGIGGQVDLERLFHDVDIDHLADGRNHLILRSTHAIEQLLFTKVHLYFRLYRHQKVLAADGLMQSLVWLIRENDLRLCGVDFSRVSDFLRVTDADILGARSTDRALDALLRGLRERRALPQRALVLSADTIRGASGASGPAEKIFELVRQVSEVEGGRTALRDEIYEAIPTESRPPNYTIIPTVPVPPPLREASQVFVKLRGWGEPRTLNSLFRVDEWLTTYTNSHWAGFVFARPEDAESVRDAAIEVLQGRGIDVDAEAATAMRQAPIGGALPRRVGAPRDEREGLKPTRVPVLERYTVEAVQAGKKPFDGLYAVLILHFLADLTAFLERFERLGLDPKKTVLVRKPYQYPQGKQVTRELTNRGYVVELCTAAEGVEDAVPRALDKLEALMPRDGQFFVVEDGGFIAPALHTKEHIDLRERCLGVVEQTMKGVRNDEAIGKARLPIIAIGKSSLKEALEAPEVGDALGFALEKFWREELQQTLARTKALVIGYGNVGRNVARALDQRRARVWVHDRAFKQVTEAQRADGVQDVIEELTAENLSDFDLIVGTTGTTSLGEALLKTMKGGVVLASGSSDRLEVDLVALRRLVAEPQDNNITLDGFLTTYRMVDGSERRVLCDGHPINFVMGEGIAKSVIDPVLTELLAAAVVICEESRPAGIDNLPEELEKAIWEMYRAQA